MAEVEGDDAAPDALLVWALASFHAALIVAVAVGLLYATGLLGNQLAALDTSVGLVAYGYLWAVTWWTNRRMLASIDGDLLSGGTSRTDVLVTAMAWGGLAGVLVFLPPFALVFAFVVAAGGLESLLFLVIAAVVGVLVAAGAGAVVGGVLSVLDLGLLRAARAWVPAGTAGQDAAARTDTP